MIKVRVTNPYHHEIFTTEGKLEDFKSNFNAEVEAVGFVKFEDYGKVLVTISPSKFASVEIYEEER